MWGKWGLTTGGAGHHDCPASVALPLWSPTPFLLLSFLQTSWLPDYLPLWQGQVLPPTVFCTTVPSAGLHRLGLVQGWLLLPLCRKSHCGLSTAFSDPSPGRCSGPNCRTFLFFYGKIALSINLFFSCFVHLPLDPELLEGGPGWLSSIGTESSGPSG